MDENHFFNSDLYKQYSDPFYGYRQSAETALPPNNKELNFARACYDVFIMSEDGRKLWELIKERLLFENNFMPSMTNPSESAIYEQGLKKGMLRLYEIALQYQTMIAQQEKKNGN